MRIQWDPERSLALAEQSERAIQIGLSGEAVSRYVDSWITRIEDVTALAREVEAAVNDGDLERARGLVPIETAYPLPAEIARRIACTDDEV